MVARFWNTSYWAGETTVSGEVDTPTLVVADNGDGTGAVATISDSTTGSTNEVYVQAFGGDLGTDDWTLAGSRTGDGVVALAIATGHYLAYCLSSVGANTVASAVYYLAVTDSGDSVLYRCLVAARGRIQALAISGLSAESVLVKKLPLERVARNDSATLPIVLLTPQRETMDPRRGMVGTDDVSYGVLCTIVMADNQEPTLEVNLDKLTLWRERIAKAFRNQRLSGVSEIISASVEPGDQIVPAYWSGNLLVSALLLRFTSRETRGLT